MNLFGPELPQPPLAGQYQVLYIDNPWPENGGGKIKRGADGKYKTMKVADIIALNREFGFWAAPNAHLYSWSTNNYLPEALECIKAAGFRYVTKTTWVKDKIGLGQYFRGKSEDCLFAVRGRLPYRVRADGKRAQGETAFFEPETYCDESGLIVPPADLPEAFEAPHVRDPDTGKIIHSRKPEQMRKYIELVSGEVPRLEMFARIATPGFDLWGNEAP